MHADPVDPMPVNENHALLSALPAEAVDALLAVAGQGSGSPQAIVELRLLGGALAREPRHRSAFCHRDAAFALTVIGALIPEIAAMVVEHAAGVVAALAPWSTGGQMPNFAPSYDPARPSRVYSEDTRHWLAALADRYDPARVLATGQVIRTAVAPPFSRELACLCADTPRIVCRSARSRPLSWRFGRAATAWVTLRSPSRGGAAR